MKRGWNKIQKTHKAAKQQQPAEKQETVDGKDNLNKSLQAKNDRKIKKFKLRKMENDKKHPEELLLLVCGFIAVSAQNRFNHADFTHCDSLLTALMN